MRHHFGTLNRAVEAAGLRPRVPCAHAQRGVAAPAQLPAPRPQQILALRVRSVATAANREAPSLLLEALNDLAVAAFSWADEIRADVA